MDTLTTNLLERLRAAGRIPAGAVLSSYRGRPGCGCGCRGVHSNGARAIALRTAFVAERLHSDNVRISGPWHAYGDNEETVVCVSYEDADTYVWLYMDHDLLEQYV